MGEGSRRAEGISGEGIENDRLELAAESRACRVRASGPTELSEKRIGLQPSRLQDCFHPTPLLIPGHIYWQLPPRKIFMNKSRYQPVNPKSLTVHRILEPALDHSIPGATL